MAGDSPENIRMTNGSESVLSVGGCLKVIGVLVLLTIVVMVALFILARSTAEWVIGGIGQGLSDLGEAVAAIPESVAGAVKAALRTEVRATLETSDEVAESVKGMGFLVTASQSATTNVHGSISSGIFGLCGVTVGHSATGTVEAGIDLEQVSAGDITFDLLEGSWTLTLGEPRLHSCRIDYIEQQKNSLTLCSQPWDEYRRLAEAEAMREILELVQEEGLLGNAQTVADNVLRNFLSAVTGSDNISIVFESEPDVDLPESCRREPPTGWKFDEESDSWVRE